MQDARLSAELPGSIRLTCSPGFASSNDQLLVWSSGANSGLDEFNHLEVGETSLYLFDAFADGTANLILLLRRTPEQYLAELYDDQDQDGAVRYRLQDRRIVIEESQHWTVQVAAKSPWRDPLGRVNYNLSLLIDGQVFANWGADWYLNEFTTDGRVDFRLLVRDADLDGSPDYEVHQSYQSEEFWWLASTWLGVAERAQKPPLQGSVIFPYLGSGYPDFMQRYNNVYAPIQVDWQTGRIITVKEFVPGHDSEEVYYIQSFARFGEQPDSSTYANFENPVCWYDLAQDADGYPEMHLRQEYYGVEDEYHWWEMPPTYSNNLRYTWDQDNDLSWDYKLGLLGSYPLDRTVQFPEFKVATIPCTEFPDWITSKAWGPATFVTAYARNFGEGIYDWGVIDFDLFIHMLGYADPPDIFTELPAGFRGEFTYDLGAQPWLYLHPVDRMLHLKGSQQGFYQVDEQEVIRYQDQDGDGYIDRWQAYQDEELVGTLNLIENYLVYADLPEHRLVVRRLDALPEFELTLPPRNHDEWSALGAKLGQEYDAGALDLAEATTRLPGMTYAFEAADLLSSRVTPDGLRLEVDLHPGYRYTLPQEEQLALSDGIYILTIGLDNALSATPGGAPALKIERSGFKIIPSEVVALQPAELTWEVLNAGAGDAQEVSYIFTLASPSGEVTRLNGETECIPSQGAVMLRQPWSPTEPGAWQVRLEINTVSRDGSTTATSAQSSASFAVLPYHEPSIAVVFSLPNASSPRSVLILLYFLTLLLFGLGIFLKLVRAQRS